MNKYIIKIIVFLFFVIILFNNVVFAKYNFEIKFTIAKINIDITPPKIELINIQNINKSNNTKLKKVIIQIKVIENNIKKNNLVSDNIIVLVDNKETKSKIINIKELEKNNKYIIYQLQLEDLKEKENLQIQIKKGTIVDESENMNEEKIINIIV